MTSAKTCLRTLVFPTFAALFLVSLAACHQEGPAEKAGQSLDNAGQKVQDTINPPGPAQKAGRALDKLTQ
jgi:predicted small lipoprotein YifL